MDVISKIKGLPTRQDRSFVKKAFYKMFPDAKDSRFKNALSREDVPFNSKEIFELNKLFVKNEDGKYVLDQSQEVLQLIS